MNFDETRWRRALEYADRRGETFDEARARLGVTAKALRHAEERTGVRLVRYRLKTDRIGLAIKPLETARAELDEYWFDELVGMTLRDCVDEPRQRNNAGITRPKRRRANP